MSKFLGITVVLAVLALSAGLDGNDFLNQAQTKMFDDALKQFVQNFMTKIRTEGIASLNIPSIDPFILNNFHQDVNNNYAKVSLNVIDFIFAGITQVDIPKASLDLIGMKFYLVLNWPFIHAQGSYGLKGTVLKLFPTFGRGNFWLDIQGLSLETSGRFEKDLNNFVRVGKLQMFPNIDHVNATITGILNNELFSKIASKAITQSIATVNQYPAAISGIVSPNVQKWINDWLFQKRTMKDIVSSLGITTIPAGINEW